VEGTRGQLDGVLGGNCHGAETTREDLGKWARTQTAENRCMVQKRGSFITRRTRGMMVEGKVSALVANRFPIAVCAKLPLAPM